MRVGLARGLKGALLAVVSVACVTAFAGAARAADATVAADPLAGFGDWVTKLLAREHVPGASVSVVRGDDVLLAQGYGCRDTDTQAPVTPDTLFFIGSCTKAFTDALAQTLVDEDKLSWEKPAKQYLPQLKLGDKWLTDNVTLLDMMTHRTGYDRHDDLWGSDPTGDRWTVVKRLGEFDPDAPIRTQLLYNNIMYIAIGCAIERASQSSWEALMAKRILQPAGMTETKVTLDDFEAAPDHSLCYGLQTGEPTWIPSMDTHSVAPAGGVYSSARDMARWVSLNLGKGKLGGKTIVSRTGMAFLQSPHMLVEGSELANDPTNGSNYVTQLGYGGGWLVEEYRGRPRISHGGALQGFLTYVAFYPKDRVGWSVMINALAPKVTGYISDELQRRFAIGK